MLFLSSVYHQVIKSCLSVYIVSAQDQSLSKAWKKQYLIQSSHRRIVFCISWNWLFFVCQVFFLRP